MSERSEHDKVARRGIPIILGGAPRPLPPLVIADSEEWQELFFARIGAAWTELGGVGEQPQLPASSQFKAQVHGADPEATGSPSTDWTALFGLLAGLTPLQIELLVAYDKGGALGGTEWIRANADRTEVYEAIKAIVVHELPFLRDALKAPGLLQGLLRQVQASSTPSPSPSGDASPTRSGRT